MPLSEKKKVSNNRYLKSTFDEIKVRVAKGQKETLQAHAQGRNESLNAFINRAINETVKRDSGQTEQHTETGIEVARRLATAQGWTPPEKKETWIEGVRRAAKERQQGTQEGGV